LTCCPGWDKIVTDVETAMAYRFAFRLKGGPFHNRQEFRLEAHPFLMVDTMLAAAKELVQFVAILQRCQSEQVDPDKIELLSCWRDTRRLEKRVVQEAILKTLIALRPKVALPKEPVRPPRPVQPPPPGKKTLWDLRRRPTQQSK
jgi:hypothetical protein